MTNNNDNDNKKNLENLDNELIVNVRSATLEETSLDNFGEEWKNEGAKVMKIQSSSHHNLGIAREHEHIEHIQVPHNKRRGSHHSLQSFKVPVAFQETSVRVEEARNHLKHGHLPSEKAQQNIKHEIEMDDHLISMDELCARYDTSEEDGLSNDQAAKLLEKYGENKLTPPKQKPWWVKLLLEMVTPFALVLWAAAALTIIAYSIPSASNDFSNLIVGIALILIIVITGVFSFYQNNKGSNAMGGFRSMMPQSTTVIRGGQKTLLDASQIVPGDLVVINVGDKIPADIRMCYCEHMQVDNACLTGETEPQTRSTEANHDNPLEASNLAFASTTTVGGSGRGIVIQTGDNTMIGKLADLVNNGTEKLKTPMMVEINNFVKLITLVGSALGLTFLIVGLVRKMDWVDTVVLCIGIIVANVPEGLPSAIAVSLALAAKRMARKNVLVTDKLNVVETLGRTTVICSDKTGTLTQNIMTVNNVWFDGKTTKAADATEMYMGQIASTNTDTFEYYYKVTFAERIAAPYHRKDFHDGGSTYTILDGVRYAIYVCETPKQFQYVWERISDFINDSVVDKDKPSFNNRLKSDVDKWMNTIYSHKEEIATAWSLDKVSFFTKSTSRVEGENSVCKRKGVHNRNSLLKTKKTEDHRMKQRDINKSREVSYLNSTKPVAAVGKIDSFSVVSSYITPTASAILEKEHKAYTHFKSTCVKKQ
eukprot:Pgem_evm1s14583